MSFDYNAEVFCIGTELLTGLTQDTNSHWLAKELALLGCTLRRVTVVPDDPEDMKDVLRQALERETPLILTSGGLGPTPDDLTVAVVSQMLGVKPVVHEGILADLMARRGLKDRSEVRPALLTMCRVPENSRAYSNPVGAAPCIHIEQGKSNLFIMPGVPREVQGIFEAHIRPFIRSASPYRVASTRVVVNMLEAEVGPLLAQLMGAYPGTYLKGALTQAQRIGTTQHLPVDVVARAESDEGAAAKLSQTLEHFGKLLAEKDRQFITG
ncbi:MAG: molybdopterin binding domain [Dehalococcoidia bacterium]|nr:molybdopterin binding domain [Dehalococcoidia bacterium]